MASTNTRAATTLIAALAFASLTGCRTVSGMRSADLTEGVQHSFAADYGEVTQAALLAVESLNFRLEAVEQLDPDTWHVIASSGASLFSWGELVRISVRRYLGRPVSVWVLTRRKVITNITANDDYSLDVLVRMDTRLRRRWPPPPPPPPAVAPPAVAPAPSPSPTS